MNILYGVGVGPGDPEHMTLKAVRIIKECNIIVVPCENKEDSYAYKIVKHIIPEIDDKSIICMPFPMIKDKEKLNAAHNEMAAKICDLLKHDSVAFLTIGDPAVYSTYMYIHNRLTDQGLEAMIVSGVTSFCAVAAALGISLGENSDEIHIIPASYDLSLIKEHGGTNIYMKAGRKLGELISHLDKKLRTNPMKVYGVANCGLEDQKIYRSFEELKKADGTDYLMIVITKEIR